jgi:hypothetical protein
MRKAPTIGSAGLGTPATRAGANAALSPDDHVPDLIRVLNAPTRPWATPVCAVFGHLRTNPPWNRWAFGWDREVACRRCGKLWHERARLPAPFADDRAR